MENVQGENKAREKPKEKERRRDPKTSPKITREQKEIAICGGNEGGKTSSGGNSNV